MKKRPAKLKSSRLTNEDLFNLALCPWGLHSEPFVRIREARIAKGLSGSYLAPRYSFQCVSDWERNKKPIPFRDLPLIAKKCGVSVTWIFSGVELKENKISPLKSENKSFLETVPSDFIQPEFLKPFYQICLTEMPWPPLDRLRAGSPLPDEKLNEKLRSWAWFLANKDTANHNPDIEVEQHYNVIGKPIPKYDGPEVDIPISTELHASLSHFPKIHDDYRQGVIRRFVINDELAWYPLIGYSFSPSGVPSPRLQLLKNKPPEIDIEKMLAEKPTLPKGFTDRKARK